jgi:hypothetical protein
MKPQKKAITAKVHILKDPATGRWFVYYSFRNPATDKLERFKAYEGFSELKSYDERQAHGKKLVQKINKKLRNGWSPFQDGQHAIYEDVIGYFQEKEKAPYKEVDYSIEQHCNTILAEKAHLLRPDLVIHFYLTTHT